MSDSFKSLMKGKGLLGGKYAPVAVMDGLEAKASMFEEDNLGEHKGPLIYYVIEVGGRTGRGVGYEYL